MLYCFSHSVDSSCVNAWRHCASSRFCSNYELRPLLLYCFHETSLPTIQWNSTFFKLLIKSQTASDSFRRNAKSVYRSCVLLYIAASARARFAGIGPSGPAPRFAQQSIRIILGAVRGFTSGDAATGDAGYEVTRLFLSSTTSRRIGIRRRRLISSQKSIWRAIPAPKSTRRTPVILFRGRCRPAAIKA